MTRGTTDQARVRRSDPAALESAAAPGAWRCAAAVARREWMSLVLAPVGWIALAAFSLPPGLAFAAGVIVPGAPVSLRLPLTIAAWSLFVVAPVLAWRSVGEERRAGTWETLVASPASSASIVLGKLASQWAFLLLLMAPLAVMTGIVSIVARPDLGEIACGVLGIWLAGAMVLSSALWFSLIAPGPAAAYLVTIGTWSAWILLGRALPALVPPAWMAVAHAIDPLRRVDDFLLGLIDPAGAIFLLGVTAWFVIASIDAVAEQTRHGAAAPRRRVRALLLVGGAAAVSLAVSIASQPTLRSSIDLTRGRSWTLSDRTRALVEGLDGEWRIEAIAGPDTVDHSALRQLDEVLARFNGLTTHGGRVRAGRIDPGDPAESASYDEALERLERTFAIPLREHRVAIDEGLAAFERLAAWAGAESNALTALLSALPMPAAGEVGSASATTDTPAGAASTRGANGGASGSGTATAALPSDDRASLEQWRATCARLASDHRSFIDARRTQARSSAAAPLGDPAGAAAFLESALRAWIDQCAGTEQALRELRRREGLPREVIDYLRDAPRRSLDMAQQLAPAQDRLSRLPTLGLAEVALALKGGDAVIVSGPDRVAAIPGWQLLPPVEARGDGRSFDRRFRGEEAIASALRALARGLSPEVIVVHAEGRSLLKPSQDRADLSAVADALRSARCSVREWQPALEPRPQPRDGRRIVWLVVPPLRRAGVDLDPRERKLLDACDRLVAGHDPMLLVLAPSMLPLVGQPDPWSALASRLGVDARTGATILELVATSERTREVRAFFEVEAAPDHPSSRGASGMSTLVSEPVELRAGDGAVTSALLEIPAATNRWSEEDWRSAARRAVEVPRSKVLDRPAMVLAASVSPSNRRTIVSGGAAWILSGLADLTGSLGQERAFLRYPGNRELLVGVVGWLAGLDDGLGAGSGREVERIPAMSAISRWLHAGAGAFATPLAALLIAGVVTMRRRRA